MVCSCVWVLVFLVVEELLDVVFLVLVVVAFCDVDVCGVVLLLVTVAGVDVLVDILILEVWLLSGDTAGL